MENKKTRFHFGKRVGVKENFIDICYTDSLDLEKCDFQDLDEIIEMEYTAAEVLILPSVKIEMLLNCVFIGVVS